MPLWCSIKSDSFLWIAKNWITDLKLMQILIEAHSFCEENIYIHMWGLYKGAPGISTTN